MANKKAKLTEGSIKKLLIQLTLPMIVGMLSMTVFNLTDTYFIGQLGKNQLAAMSFTFPIVMILNSIALGLGMGASSNISRAIGEGDSKKVKRLATDALLLGVIIVAFFIVAGELTINPLFRLLGAGNELLPLIHKYMRIWYIGVIFVVIPMIGNNIIRATGDMKTPGLIMASIAILNMILDPILIFGLGPFNPMGIEGGAIATVLSRAVGMVFSFIIIIGREKLIDFTIPLLSELISSWKKILYIGIPAAASNMIIPFSMGIITRLVSTYGTAAVAGFGVGTRLEMLSLMIIMALSSVLVPFTGQNIGAGKIERIYKALKISYIFSLLWGAGTFLIFLFTGKYLGALFNKDPFVIETVTLYLNFIAISYGIQGFMYLSSATLNALNKPLYTMVISITRMFILYVPLALIGSKLFGLKGIFIGASLSNVITGLFSLYLVFKMLNKLKNKRTR
ncbi:MAG: MATE family efflux transporter [Spirochaetaceae bacterium]|jgi:putative MATE family efflux protein|nr:MATE family efflux transporter [Spirochaetaceae bacterium]